MKKDKMISLRIDNKTLDNLKYLQDYYGLSMSALINFLINQKFREIS
jgi:antitoxin component of RelBE/YafQ-DinJ toxin-antitoxin module